MYCKNCGKEINENQSFCPHCGAGVNNEKSTVNSDKKPKCMCLPSFILGLIGGIFGMFGGICTTMCSILSRDGNSAFIFIFIGAIVGLIGACLCFTNTKLGSILEGVSAISMIIRAFSSGATFSVVIGILFMLAAAIIGAVYSFIIKRS